MFLLGGADLLVVQENLKGHAHILYERMVISFCECVTVCIGVNKYGDQEWLFKNLHSLDDFTHLNRGGM